MDPLGPSRDRVLRTTAPDPIYFSSLTYYVTLLSHKATGVTMSTRRVLKAVAPALLAGLLPGRLAAAPHLTTLYTFTNGTDGGSPQTGLLAGPNGSLMGAMLIGGTQGVGSLYQLTPPTGNEKHWHFTNLYSFSNGPTGNEPGALVADNAGNIYGEANVGGIGCGSVGCGTLFRLSPPVVGKSIWSETTLYQFTGKSDGANPFLGLAIDDAGNLFGYSPNGGNGNGTVFELSLPASGQTSWTLTTLYKFKGRDDGVSPETVPLLGADGSLYGNATAGGFHRSAECATASYGFGCGLVFRLSPPTAGQTSWTKTTLHGFLGTDGVSPLSTLVADASGDLFGLTYGGGLLGDCAPNGQAGNGCGTVFEIRPPAAGQTIWSRTTIWKFTGGRDGAFPDYTALTPWADGYLATSDSAIILLQPRPGHHLWRASTWHEFTGGKDGTAPNGPLLYLNGSFYGTTQGNLNSNSPSRYGTIFRLDP